MTDDLSDFFADEDIDFLLEDAAMASNISDEALADVQSLGNRMLKLEQLAATLEEKVKLLKEASRVISDDKLPKMLMKVGISKFTLMTGEEVSMTNIVQANMPKAEEPEMFEKAVQWLDDHELGDIIKKDVVAKFGKGEQEMAERAMQALISVTNGAVPVTLKDSVNYMTLNSVLKQRMTKGEALPTVDDGFSIYVGPRAKIAKPKKSKGS